MTATRQEGRRKEESSPGAVKPPEEAAAAMLQDRFRALVDGDSESLKGNYDAESDTGLWSWEKEALRVRYFQEWAKGRGLEVIQAKARIEVDSVSPAGTDAVWVELTEHASYAYRSARRGVTSGGSSQGGSNGDWTHTFGSRAVHVLELVLREGSWKIRRDWYADPLGQESHLPPCEYPPESVNKAKQEPSPDSGSQDRATPGSGTGDRENTLDPYKRDEPPQRFDREAAREYAIRYAGVPAIEGSGKYNPRFRVYTFAGGDCANFASQVLEAGGLTQGYGWHYTSEGSPSWVRGEDLVWHLLATGRGKRLYSGTFAGAVKRTAEYPEGIASELEPGDLIAYECKGQISHVAVVVGKDSAGYVTVASHTADRLFFPWDLGWNDNTVFWLIKIT